MFGYSRDGAWPSLPAQWRPWPGPEPREHQFAEPDGRCSAPRCGVHFLDATGPCEPRGLPAT